MDNWLNVFSAVRNGNLAEEEMRSSAANRQLAQDQNKRAFASQDLQQQQGQREQQTFDTERATRTTLGALSAFSNMADSITNNSSIAEADRPAAYAAAFDRIAPALQASGYDPERIAGIRDHLIQNPAQASDLLAGLQEGIQGSTGSRQGLQAAFDSQGNAVFIDPRTGRAAARGYAPATAVLGQNRIGVSQQNANTNAGNLEQRIVSNDPNHTFDQSAARSEGQVAGTAAAHQPEALAANQQVINRIDTILNAPPDQLADVLGAPSLGGALRGGFGQAGAWPGSERANIQSDINGLTSSMRSAAYQLVLKGGGSITEAESAFAAQAFVNLDRSQSPSQFRHNLETARNYFVGLGNRYQRQAAPTRNPNREDSTRAPARAAPAPAPSRPQLSDEELLQRYSQ